jgi:hypothetical protein
VFCVDTENRQRRIEIDQITIIDMRNGEIKPHGERRLSESHNAVGSIKVVC